MLQEIDNSNNHVYVSTEGEYYGVVVTKGTSLVARFGGRDPRPFEVGVLNGLQFVEEDGEMPTYIHVLEGDDVAPLKALVTPFNIRYTSIAGRGGAYHMRLCKAEIIKEKLR